MVYPEPSEEEMGTRAIEAKAEEVSPPVRGADPGTDTFIGDPMPVIGDSYPIERV
jgi:hypothetical protein